MKTCCLFSRRSFMAMPEIKPLCCRCSSPGIDVWPFLHRNSFPNHTQYGMWQGMAMPHGELSAIISGLDDLQSWRNAMPYCPGILEINAIVKR